MRPTQLWPSVIIVIMNRGALTKAIFTLPIVLAVTALTLTGCKPYYPDTTALQEFKPVAHKFCGPNNYIEQDVSGLDEYNYYEFAFVIFCIKTPIFQGTYGERWTGITGKPIYEDILNLAEGTWISGYDDGSDKEILYAILDFEKLPPYMSPINEELAERAKGPVLAIYSTYAYERL